MHSYHITSSTRLGRGGTDSYAGYSRNAILSRRQWLDGMSATAVSGFAATAAASGQQTKPAADPFTYRLNTATVRGQGLSIVDGVD